MIYSKIDDFTNSIFRDLDGNFNWKVLVAMLIGITIGMLIAASIYAIMLLFSLKRSEKKMGDLKEIDEDLLETLKLIKKDYTKITSGFSASEKMKVLGNTIVNTIKMVAQKYYPDSNHPIYELNINELIVLAHYITDRIDKVFDKGLLKYFKNMSISKVLTILDINKKVQSNKVVKTVKKVNPVVKVVKSIANVANPVHWVKKLLFGGIIGSVLNRASLMIIDIVGSETVKVYSKRLFNEENNLLEEMIENEIAEMEELGCEEKIRKE